MPAGCVKPCVKRGRTDAADAEAICEAVSRPTMRFVPVKPAGQQAVLMLHRTRELLVRQRTMLVNALRGHMQDRAHRVGAAGPGRPLPCAGSGPGGRGLTAQQDPRRQTAAAGRV